MPPRAPTKSAAPKKRFWSRSFQYALIGAFLLAPLLALLVQFLRVPDEEPAVVGSVRPRALSPFIAGLLANPKGSEFEFSPDEVNMHLGQLLPSLRKNASSTAIQRLELRLEPGGCTVATTYRWKGADWHVRLHYKVSIEAGRLHIKTEAGSLGRVALGPRWTNLLQAPLLKLLPLLKKESILLNRLEHIRLEPNRVLLKVRPSSSMQSP